MRLIDADLSKVMFMQRARLVHYGFADRLCVPYDAVDEVPTVGDAVLVVRCRECKHCRNLPNGLCYLYTEPCDNERGYKGEAVCVEPDDYCSCGEREENMK